MIDRTELSQEEKESIIAQALGSTYCPPETDMNNVIRKMMQWDGIKYPEQSLCDVNKLINDLQKQEINFAEIEKLIFENQISYDDTVKLCKEQNMFIVTS